MPEEMRNITIGIGLVMIIVTASVLGYVLLRDEDGNNNGGTVNDHPVGDWTGPYLDDRNATDAGIDDMVYANNQFGIDILQKLAKNNEDNIFISPYSIFTALSMTYEGTDGNTATEIADVLHLPDKDRERLGSFASIQNDINAGSSEYDLATANAIWPKIQYEWKDLFIDTIKQYYYGKVQELDYQADPEQCREIINDWVENQTNDLIEDLLPENLLTPLTYMVLTNAIYFKGEWVYEFNEDETEDETFTTPGGNIDVPMMHLRVEEDDKLPYFENNEIQAVELPYKGEELSMVLVLPRDGDIDPFIEGLDSEKIDYINEGLSPSEGSVAIPKFKLETKYELVPIMQALGMNDAFIPGVADFSGMSDDGMAPAISNIIHQTYIEVDEKGSEAAAATAVVILERAVENEFHFNADSPFLYMIKQNDTGNILFMGTMKDPSA